MNNKIFEFDVAVVGGGPAGMMAAIRSAEKGARVVLVEKNEKLGTKLLMSGGGRCNVSQAEFDVKKLAESYKNGKFLLSSLRVFGPAEFMRYFEKNGIELKVEKNGRVFPKSNKALDVVEMLRKKMLENGVNLFMGGEVERISLSENNIKSILLKDEREIIAREYIIATGGKSYPSSGSTGQGYDWAKKLGHKIVNPKPSLVPVVFRGDKHEILQGISLSDVSVGLYFGKKKVFSEKGDIIFTHFGLSGPLILNISRRIGEEVEKFSAIKSDISIESGVFLKIDLKPYLDVEKLDEIIRNDFERNAGKKIGNCFENLFSEKIRDYVLFLSGVDIEKHAGKISRIERRKIVFLIKGLEFEFENLLGFERAMVTSGGVSTTEIDSKTMRSKLISNLFFAGEILNVDGPTGGYNLQMCWSMGYVAGENAWNNFKA